MYFTAQEYPDKELDSMDAYSIDENDIDKQLANGFGEERPNIMDKKMLVISNLKLINILIQSISGIICWKKQVPIVKIRSVKMILLNQFIHRRGN